ncbi:hypothetical protein EYF80_050815 [Liparis tanakae]|uniref:Secreted protein n=1 Tax=Liparis tanakae TaxID=230148 RepID=A0A4Z2FE14_9TELE|nr:hypothetical protein EYF80_050815 [Liparis tanakae]
MTALASMGTGLLSMVLRLLSSRCHETEGRGSPDAWHSSLTGWAPLYTRHLKLADSPTRTAELWGSMAMIGL